MFDTPPPFETLAEKRQRKAQEAGQVRDREISGKDDTRIANQNAKAAERGNASGELVWLRADEKKLVGDCKEGAREIDRIEGYQDLIRQLPRLKTEQANRVRRLHELQERIERAGEEEKELEKSR